MDCAMPLGRGLRCVLIGDQSLLTACGDILRRRGHDIRAVVTENASVAAWAQERSVAVAAPGDDLATWLANHEHEWFFSIANLRMLPEAVWRQAKIGAINFHDGPLPRYAGLNAPVWAILNGETSFGVTWHEITAGIDAGEIYVQRTFDISSDETAFTLNSKCFEAAIASFDPLVDALEAGAPQGRAQDFSTRSVFARDARPAAAGLLQLGQGAAELDRLVRALDFGPGYRNPLVAPKILVGDEALPVSAVEQLDTVPIGPVGQVLDAGDDAITVVVGDGAVKLRLAGGPRAARVEVGSVLKSLPVDEANAAKEAAEGAARGEAELRRRLASADPLTPQSVRDGLREEPIATVAIPAADLTGSRLVAALLAFLARDCGAYAFDLAYSDAEVAARAHAHPALFSAAAPLRVAATGDMSAADFSDRLDGELRALRRRGGWLKDLVLREPGLREPRWPVGLACADAPSAGRAIAGCALTFVAPTGAGDVLLAYDPAQLAEPDAMAMARRAEIAIRAFASDASLRLRDLPLMSAEAERELLASWSRSGDPYDPSVCMHQAVERQARKTPDLVALTCGPRSLTFRELDARADKVAQVLLRRGVGRDAVVGLHMSRSVDLVVGALGVMKAGGAYLPLDPAYPADRLAFMVEDSGAPVILTERALASGSLWAAPSITIEDIEREEATGERPDVAVAGDALAYVIYTSGSTGRPKGVMIEHRNVANFFAGMDERIPVDGDRQPVWLAVTSLSFDISVLELFWTLSRGFHVVMAEAPSAEAQRPQGERSGDVAGVEFGLFYWGTDDGSGRRKYQLLLEGAKFADAHGFSAVWTPERHFHAFGDPYPNPAVTGAAVAAVTKNLSIRAGSCVLPLHHPARVAEEWAVVDNMSDGRVGLAFASGWMPEDFVLRPENAPPHNKAAMLRDIEVVRRLWRGEKVAFPLSDSKSVDVVTHPRPLQKELPVWVTTAGNPDTYREAAALGANVLTHLLGQSIEELADKIRIYRAAVAESGRDPAASKVTLMLHTLVGADREKMREIAREPMKGYLRSAAALIKQYAWAFPAFKKPIGAGSAMDIDLTTLSAEEMDAILDFAFERYFEDSGLFGTVEDALARVAELKTIGVDEIACLIDFGVDSDVVMAHLAPLAEVVAAANLDPAAAPEGDFGIAAQIARHRVTHLQCTPSMAGMLLDDPETRAALSGVRRLFIGGEALTGALLSELASVTAAPVENMYGPTETTIWSSTGPARLGVASVPLGAPIANTQLYVLDGHGRPCPPLCPGELFIAGDGVARGYLHRPELTAEKFVPDPFAPGGRMYRTGDLVVLTGEGELRYLARADGQVKLRGRRIELGEIEARLRELPGVREAVALVREDRVGDARLVAYVQPNGAIPAEPELRAHLAAGLPDYMVPAHFVTVETFPQTPNAKIDRKALPRPDEVRTAEAPRSFTPASDPVQKQVADVFARVLGLAGVGLDDNFFALGGHSLLAVQAHRELKASIAPDLRITDLFRFPTVAELARRIAGEGEGTQELKAVSDRAALRRRALSGGRSLPGLPREVAS